MYSDGRMMEAQEFIKNIAGLNDFRNLSVKEFSAINSSKITPDFWLRLSMHIQSLSYSEDVSGVVITHGTDTLEETSFFLDLTIDSSKPIVLTGSMRSADEADWDGPDNLINAIRVAKDPRSIGEGSMAVMQGTIFSPASLIKLHNSSLSAFESSSGIPKGVVSDVKVEYSPEKTSIQNFKFDLALVKQLPRVDLLQDYTGMEKDILEYHYQRDVDGLILQAFGGGRLSEAAQQWVDKLTLDGIPVVICSSVPKGRILNNPYTGKPIIFTHALKGNKARILLMLSLTTTREISEIQAIFNRY